jgi:outer membrane protein assembly factor BamA
VLEIHEGAKTGVKKIRFIGNLAYSSEELKGAITTGETNVLTFSWAMTCTTPTASKRIAISCAAII